MGVAEPREDPTVGELVCGPAELLSAASEALGLVLTRGEQGSHALADDRVVATLVVKRPEARDPKKFAVRCKPSISLRYRAGSMIVVQCSSCGAKLRTSQDKAGSVARCPKCKSRISVPEPQPIATPPVIEEPDPPPATEPEEESETNLYRIMQESEDPGDDWDLPGSRPRSLAGRALPKPLEEHGYRSVRAIALLMKILAVTNFMIPLIAVALTAAFTEIWTYQGAGISLAVLGITMVQAVLLFAAAELMLALIRIEENTRTTANAVIAASR